MMDLAVIESEASGPIRSGWSERKLQDVAQLINGRGFKPFEWNTAGLPIIRIQNLNGSDDFNYYSGRYDPKIEVDPGQLLFAWSGSRGTSFGPHIWNGPKGVLNYHTWKVRVNATEIVPSFFFHVLKHLTRIIEDQAHGASALVHVQKWEMEKFPFQCPDDPKEQEAIAEALSDADALIEGLERLVAMKRLIKQGAMQDLLTAKRRLPGFSGEWVETSLRKLLKSAPSYAINSAACALGSGGYDYLRITDIDEHGQLRQDGRAEVLHPAAAHYFLEPDEIVVARTGASTGKSHRYVGPRERTVYAGFLIKLAPAKDAIDPGYLFQFMQTDTYWSWIGENSARSGQPGINGQQLAGMTLVIPQEFEEQQAIAGVLNDMDAEIQALDTRLEKARQVKEGMMQNLSTGRIRLV